jgi:hypothetical protein
MSRSTNKVRGVAAAGSIAAAWLACGSALGQNALGDGRKLDANLNATHGTANVRSTGVEQQIRYNNAIINGTSPNGTAFRGSVGYRGTDQFGASAGSDTLYSFHRDSLSSGLTNLGVRGSDALRYQFAMASGQRVPGFMAATLDSVPRAATVSTGASDTVLRSTANFMTAQSYRPTLVGVRQDEFGAEYVARASPLLGVSWIKTAEGTPSVPGPGQIPGVLPGATPSIGGTPTVLGTRPGTIINPFTGLETTAPGVPKMLDRPDMVNLRLEGESRQVGTALHAELVNRFRDGYRASATPLAAQGEKPAPEVNSYEAQLERLHDLLNGKAVRPNEPRRGSKPEDKPKAPSDPGAPAVSPPGSADAPKSDAEKKANPVLDALTPEFLRAVKKVREKKVEHFVEPAPVAGPDTSTDPEGYRAMMREGEQLLAQSRFFDAEERFVRAIAGAPNDPMARAGRIHAELGAGLYLSAAANLRALLSVSPETAATRYAESLLPGGERIALMVDQLSEQGRKSDSALGRESALLVAYLGYQRGDDKLVADGLDEFSRRITPGPAGDPDRALLSVLRASWSLK